MLSALYLPEILVEGERVRKGKKTRECLVTPKKQTIVRIKTQISEILAAERNTHQVPRNQNKRGHTATRAF